MHFTRNIFIFFQDNLSTFFKIIIARQHCTTKDKNTCHFREIRRNIFVVIKKCFLFSRVKRTSKILKPMMIYIYIY